MMIQTSVFVMFSDTSVALANIKEFKSDLPCSNELWEATELEWRILPSEPVWFPSAVASLFEGTPVQENISPMAVLSLLSAVLVQLATHERLTWYQPPSSDQ